MLFQLYRPVALIMFVANCPVLVDGFTSRQSTVRCGAVLPAFYHGTAPEYSHETFNELLHTFPATARGRGDDSIMIASHADWLELMHGHNDDGDGDDTNHDDRLSLVLFKAAFCKSCQRLERQWKQKVIPLAGPSLQIATVEFTTNKALFKQLMIKDLPTIQFYRHGNLLTDFPCPPKDFSKIMDTLHYYLYESQPPQPKLQQKQQQQQQ